MDATFSLRLVTGSIAKWQEISQILSPEILLGRLDIDLAEIQSLNPQEVIAHKLCEAEQHARGRYIVEDTSICLPCLNGLPGPLAKWFDKTLGCDGLVRLTQRLGDDRASVSITIGYLAPGESPQYFDGTVHGRIVPPRGDKDYGFGPSFLPDGATRTYGEMEREEKHAISSRGVATRKFKDYLLSL